MKKNLHIALMIILSALVRAVGYQLFLLPNSILVGGVLGFAGVLELTLGYGIFKASYWVIILNVPLIILSYVKLGKRITIKTTINVLLTAIFMWIIEYTNLAASFDVIGGEYKVLYAIIGGFLVGVALPLMLSIQGSTGGSDIVALLIRKGSSTSLMRISLFISVFTISLGALVLQDINVFVFSIVTLFCSRITEDQIFKGYSSAMVVEIITEKPNEAAEALMKQLNHGVTSVEITGMYSLTNKTQLLCVINRRQLSLARKIMRQIDGNAFAYVISVREVVGRGFVNKEQEFEDSEQQ